MRKQLAFDRVLARLSSVAPDAWLLKGGVDPSLGDPQELTAPPLLDFAGIKPATVRAIPIEQHLAEKIHAYTKRYGNRDSTRVKDLVDMALLVDHPQLNIRRLAETVRDVFAERRTDIAVSLPKPPSSWRAPYPRLAADLPVPQTSDEAHRHVAEAIANALKVPPRTYAGALTDVFTETTDENVEYVRGERAT